MSSSVVLGLGSNLAARRALIGAAIALLDGLPGCKVVARSALYVTPPLGPPQPDYLNAAVRVAWDADLPSLLACTQRIETQLGRERRLRWGPRTIDIDILWWSEGALREDALEVPHPGLLERAFALAPLLDVADELRAAWASRLLALGGAPPRAEPGWLTLLRQPDGDLATPWLREPSELAALIPALIARIAAPPVRATHTLPLEGPAPLVDEAGHCWIEEATREAFARGFAVCRAAISHTDDARLRGVLLGEAGRAPLGLAPRMVRIERLDQHELRARVSCSASDRGFGFEESFTM